MAEIDRLLYFDLKETECNEENFYYVLDEDELDLPFGEIRKNIYQYIDKMEDPERKEGLFNIFNKCEFCSQMLPITDETKLNELCFLIDGKSKNKKIKFSVISVLTPIRGKTFKRTCPYCFSLTPNDKLGCEECGTRVPFQERIIT